MAGRIVAGNLVKLACQRQLDDLSAWQSGERPDWEFRYGKAEEVCEFIEKLRHVEGQWAKRKLTIKLRGWQQFIVTTFYGWYQDKPWACLQCLSVHDGEADLCAECGEDAVAGGWLRRFTTCYEEIGRKNAKTTLGSALQLYALTGEGETGAQVFSAATGAKQARISFDIAWKMARKDPDFRDHYGVEVRAHNINVLESGSKMEPLSSETMGLDGSNPSFALIDEYHAHPNNGVYAAMETGMGAREQPILWAVTTAGYNRASPCYALRQYAVQVLEKTLDNDSFFAIIFTLDEGDDPLEDPSCWIKSNPNLGVSVFPKYLESKAEQAKANPIKQTEVLTKNFNMWLSAEARLVNMQKWDLCGEPFDMNDLKGEPCFVGIDLADRDDVAAVAIVWPRADGELWVKMRYYLPRGVVREKAHSSHKHFAGWVAEGRITLTDDAAGGDGEDINFDHISEDVANLPAQGFAVREIAIDPFHASELIRFLASKGATVVPIRNTVLNVSEETKKLIAAANTRKLHHGGDPVLAWMASNVVGHYDNKDNVYPKKQHRADKIDGFMAIVFAINRIIKHEELPVSQYGRGGKMVTSGGAET